MVKRIVFIGLIITAVVAFWQRDRLMNFFAEDTRTVNTVEVKLLFRTDPTIQELTNKLVEEEILITDKEIIELINKKGLKDGDFAAGKYIILSGTQLESLVNGFVKNEDGQGNSEVKVNVVFNRCVTIEDIGSNISKCILSDSAEIVNYIKSPTTLQKYGFTIEQMPGMFLPKTYEMYFDTEAEEFVAFMAAEFKSFWNDERKQKMKNIGLKYPSQVSTVASIVYSEQSKMSEEWPIIAALYLNRIQKGMRLESDPTFKFCWPDRLEGVERLLNRHKERDCPYNTYLHAGLPPGPICIPPDEVIDAVLNPANVDYLFMCGKPGGGGHNFAVTNREHERNVAVYRVWLKEYLKNK